CESACPSGVRYGRLLDLGRELTEEHVARAPVSGLKRYLLRKVMPYAGRARAAVSLARLARPLLPEALSRQPPRPARRAPPWPPARHARRVLLLEGCVQPALAGGINPAAARVLDRLGISAVRVSAAGCCGALAQHLGAHEDALAQLRNNVDALWPEMEKG